MGHGAAVTMFVSLKKCVILMNEQVGYLSKEL
jgi:hypothetical protein